MNQLYIGVNYRSPHCCFFVLFAYISESLKAVEKCVEDEKVCQGKENEQLMTFKKQLKEKVDKLLKKKGTTRHAATCSKYNTDTLTYTP